MFSLLPGSYILKDSSCRHCNCDTIYLTCTEFISSISYFYYRKIWRDVRFWNGVPLHKWALPHHCAYSLRRSQAQGPRTLTILPFYLSIPVLVMSSAGSNIDSRPFHRLSYLANIFFLIWSLPISLFASSNDVPALYCTDSSNCYSLVVKHVANYQCCFGSVRFFTDLEPDPWIRILTLWFRIRILLISQWLLTRTVFENTTLHKNYKIILKGKKIILMAKGR